MPPITRNARIGGTTAVVFFTSAYRIAFNAIGGKPVRIPYKRQSSILASHLGRSEAIV